MTAPSSPARGLVDTNILIYAADPATGPKHHEALRLLDGLRRGGGLVVSVQVLNEFFNVATRRNKPPGLSHGDASQLVRDLALTADVLTLTASITLRALDAMPRHGFSFWDALIWAAAKENGVGVVYTEDFQNGREVEDVRIVDPFRIDSGTS